ncbi:condensation domain-containing protein [Streptomyces diastatochromogenes]|nr:condensation domain-containing protein [Streptomyces diastatochromogenes]
MDPRRRLRRAQRPRPRRAPHGPRRPRRGPAAAGAPGDVRRTRRRGRPVRPRDLGTPLAALRRHQEEAKARGAWDEQTALWRERLDGVPSVLELPADRQRPAVQDGAGDRLGLDLGPGVTERVAARARALGITPYAFLLGAFGLTLARRTGARSLLVGVPLLGAAAPS